MKLAEYLKFHGLTHEAFAKMIGVTRPLVTHIINGRKNPSIKILLKIAEVTKGDVTAIDLYNPEAHLKIKNCKKKENVHE